MAPGPGPNGAAGSGGSRHDGDVAEFEYSRAIVGRRGRAPVALLVFVAAVGGLIAAGLAGRGPGGVAFASPTPHPEAAVRASSPPGPRQSSSVTFRPGPRASLDVVPVVVSKAGRELALLIQRDLETIAVHGDIRARGVTSVVVNLVNWEGRSAGWTEVRVPRGAEPAATDPAGRFDVELALPEWSHGPLWVQATAYDDAGFIAASEQLGVWPDGSPMVGGHAVIFGEGPAIVPVPPGAALGPQVVRLDAPADGASITKAMVAVSGRLEVKADSIRVAVIAEDRRIIAAQTIRTANLDGGIRPLHAPTFDVELGLGSPRPVGSQLWAVVTAYDEAGSAIGYARRAITVGELQ